MLSNNLTFVALAVTFVKVGHSLTQVLIVRSIVDVSNVKFSAAVSYAIPY